MDPHETREPSDRRVLGVAGRFPSREQVLQQSAQVIEALRNDRRRLVLDQINTVEQQRSVIDSLYCAYFCPGAPSLAGTAPASPGAQALALAQMQSAPLDGYALTPTILLPHAIDTQTRATVDVVFVPVDNVERDHWTGLLLRVAVGANAPRLYPARVVSAHRVEGYGVVATPLLTDVVPVCMRVEPAPDASLSGRFFSVQTLGGDGTAPVVSVLDFAAGPNREPKLTRIGLVAVPTPFVPGPASEALLTRVLTQVSATLSPVARIAPLVATDVPVAARPGLVMALSPLVVAPSTQAPPFRLFVGLTAREAQALTNQVVLSSSPVVTFGVCCARLHKASAETVCAQVAALLAQTKLVQERD